MTFMPTPETASKVGIVYSTGKKHMRAHIYCDTDAHFSALDAAVAAGTSFAGISLAGCSVAYVPMTAHLGGSDTFHQAVATAIGVPTAAQLYTDPRCVVINSAGTVINVIMADDSIDVMTGWTLVNHQLAIVGDTYNSALKQFTRPATTLPIKVGVRATAVQVPATTFT